MRRNRRFARDMPHESRGKKPAVRDPAHIRAGMLARFGLAQRLGGIECMPAFGAESFEAAVKGAT